MVVALCGGPVWWLQFNWEMFKVTFAELRRETKQLEGRLADKADSKKSDTKKQAEVATRLAALRATPRRRFSQLRAMDEAASGEAPPQA